MLDDAAYNNDAAAVITGTGTSAGTVSYAGSAVSWTGDLAVAASVTITYSVTIDNPDTGDLGLANTVTSADPGQQLPGRRHRPAVHGHRDRGQRGDADDHRGRRGRLGGGRRGGDLHGHHRQLRAERLYRRQRHRAAVRGAGNAAYNNDAAAVITGTGTSAGTVTYDGSTLGWAGDVPAAGSVTLTYSVTVNNPDTGSQILASTVTSASTGSNCRPGPPTRAAPPP